MKIKPDIYTDVKKFNDFYKQQKFDTYEFEVMVDGEIQSKTENYMDQVNSTYQRYQKQLKNAIEQNALSFLGE